MSEITKIYKKLGLPINHYQSPGGEDYKQFKLQRFKDRLKICLYFENCIQPKTVAIQGLSEEEKSQLKSHNSPRELLTIFIGWGKGELAFSSKEDRIQLIVKYEGEEHDLVEFVKTFRKKCLNQKEKCRVKNLLCLKVLETFIQEGKISLD